MWQFRDFFEQPRAIQIDPVMPYKISGIGALSRFIGLRMLRHPLKFIRS